MVQQIERQQISRPLPTPTEGLRMAALNDGRVVLVADKDVEHGTNGHVNWWFVSGAVIDITALQGADKASIQAALDNAAKELL